MNVNNPVRKLRPSPIKNRNENAVRQAIDELKIRGFIVTTELNRITNDL